MTNKITENELLEEKVKAAILKAHEECNTFKMERLSSLISSSLELDKETILERMSKNDHRKVQLLEWLLFEILCSSFVNRTNEETVGITHYPFGEKKSKDYVADALMNVEDKISMMETVILGLAKEQEIKRKTLNESSK